jgi:chromate transport protein ChrA
MKKRFFITLAWTGIASPLLMLLAYELDGTRFSWFAAPFYAPGLLVAALLLQLAGQVANTDLYLQVAFFLNFVFIWILLLAILKLLERFIYRLKARQRSN